MLCREVSQPRQIIEGRFVIREAETNVDVDVMADAAMIQVLFQIEDVAAAFHADPARMLETICDMRVVGDFQVHVGRVVAAAHTDLEWD